MEGSPIPRCSHCGCQISGKRKQYAFGGKCRYCSRGSTPKPQPPQLQLQPLAAPPLGNPNCPADDGEERVQHARCLDLNRLAAPHALMLCSALLCPALLCSALLDRCSAEQGRRRRYSPDPALGHWCVARRCACRFFALSYRSCVLLFVSPAAPQLWPMLHLPPALLTPPH